MNQTDYTKLAKEWLEPHVVGHGPCYCSGTVLAFSRFLNERASREECIACEEYGESVSAMRANGENMHTCKPQEKPCCDVCKGYCKRGFCPCHRKEENGCSCYGDVKKKYWCAVHQSTPSKAECEHETGVCILCYRPPSKALEELDEHRYGQMTDFQRWGSLKDKINSLVRYVKELERKINT